MVGTAIIHRSGAVDPETGNDAPATGEGTYVDAMVDNSGALLDPTVDDQ
ncbi:MAG: hypothetical protein ACJ789_04910 [Thermomicrobiales bacterium]